MVMFIGHGRRSSTDPVKQSRIILPDPGVLHLCKFSGILMRFCMSNNSSASSTGWGETKRGCSQGRWGGEGGPARGGVLQGAGQQNGALRAAPRTGRTEGARDKWSLTNHLSFGF